MQEDIILTSEGKVYLMTWVSLIVSILNFFISYELL